MLTVTDGVSLSRALHTPIDERIKRLLALRCDQLGGDITDHAHFAIVQAGDTVADLEGTIGFSVFQNPGDGTRLGDPDFSPGWEWIQDHGFAYELCFILDDSGFGHIIIVPKHHAIDPELITFCAQYASEHA